MPAANSAEMWHEVTDIYVRKAPVVPLLPLTLPPHQPLPDPEEFEEARRQLDRAARNVHRAVEVLLELSPEPAPSTRPTHAVGKSSVGSDAGHPGDSPRPSPRQDEHSPQPQPGESLEAHMAKVTFLKNLPWLGLAVALAGFVLSWMLWSPIWVFIGMFALLVASAIVFPHLK